MATIRPRNSKEPSFDIHHDEMDSDESLEEHAQTMQESISQLDEEEYEEHNQYEDSDYSDESDGVVDPTVLEDMEKFQQTFKGIKDRFRLINRIGEGNQPSPVITLYIDAFKVHFLLYTKQKISYTNTSTMNGTSRKRKALNGNHHP